MRCGEHRAVAPKRNQEVAPDGQFFARAYLRFLERDSLRILFVQFREFVLDDKGDLVPLQVTEEFMGDSPDDGLVGITQDPDSHFRSVDSVPLGGTSGLGADSGGAVGAFVASST